MKFQKIFLKDIFKELTRSFRLVYLDKIEVFSVIHFNKRLELIKKFSLTNFVNSSKLYL